MTTPLPARRAAAIGISAHRGDSAAHPENTLRAFRAAIETGAEGIELDVALSREGIAVVIHDLTVDRTTDGTGAVDEFTVEELRLLDAGEGEYVPTLAEVLELAAGRVEVNIEIKAPDAVDAVVTAVAAHPDLVWFSSSAHWGALEALAARIPEARIYPLSIGAARIEDMLALARAAGYTDEQLEAARPSDDVGFGGLDDAIAFAQRTGAEGVSAWEHRLTAADVERLHELGLRAWVWTINDRDRAAELMGYGVDAICTDTPAALLEERAQQAGATAVAAE